jgi:uncharacterized protein
MAMLCYNLRDLEAHALSVDGVLEGADPVWEATDVRPAAPGVQVTGRLSSAGPGRYYFSGHFEGSAAAECRRCLGPAGVEVAEELHLVFAMAGLAEADEDDVIRIPAGARELDLRPAVREEWLVALPAYALCREGCLGLCPQCGADRNTDSCSCAPAPDPRWAALGGQAPRPD